MFLGQSCQPQIWNAPESMHDTRQTPEEARYHLKTKFGVSDNFIKHSKAYPLFGMGQGSGNSPAYWLFISSTLFDMYDAKASTHQSPDKTIHVHIKAIGFVDDVQTSVNASTTMHLIWIS